MLCGSPGRTACPLEAARLVRALQSSTETSHSSSPHGRWPTPAGMKQPSLGTSCKVGSIVLSHAARASEQPALDLHFFADAASRALLAAADRTACRGRFDPLGDYRAASRCARISSPPFRGGAGEGGHKAGAKVARNVRLRDVSIDVPDSDDRRVEVLSLDRVTTRVEQVVARVHSIARFLDSRHAQVHVLRGCTCSQIPVS